MTTLGAIANWFKDSISTLAKGKGLSPAHLALILLFLGPLISYLALPIEGEYWAGLMPPEHHQRAYNLTFALDFAGGFLMYVFSRVRQSTTVKKQRAWTLAIPPFVVLGVAASAYVSQRQLAVLGVSLVESIIVACIQPGIQLGINVAQAVVEGKFEKEKVVQPKSTPELVESIPEPVESTPEPVKFGKYPGQPGLDWWAGIVERLDGERVHMTAELVHELVRNEWEEDIGRTTAYNWRDRCIEAGQKAMAN